MICVLIHSYFIKGLPGQASGSAGDPQMDFFFVFRRTGWKLVLCHLNALQTKRVGT